MGQYELFQKFRRKIKRCLDLINPFTIGDVVEGIRKDTSSILDKLDMEDVHIAKLENQLTIARRERDLYDRLIYHIGETIPDMMWHKSVNGRYRYVNNAIREGLFYGLSEEEIIGYTDVEIALKCKNLVGHDKHTFGEICGDSDTHVLRTLVKGQYLEYGLINGEDLYLNVYKAPMYDTDGVLVGTVGTGRNVTNIYLGINNAVEAVSNLCECTDTTLVENILRELNKYKFEGIKDE